MAVGLLAVVAAIGSMLRQRPAPSPAVADDAGVVTPLLQTLGPLSVGATVAGFRVERIEALGAEVRIQLARAGESYFVGLGAPTPGRPPPMVAIPDLYVWYASDAGAPPTELISEVVRTLRAGGDKGNLYQQILAWEASAGGPRVADSGPG